MDWVRVEAIRPGFAAPMPCGACSSTYQDVSELGFSAFLRPLEQKYKSKSEIVFFLLIDNELFPPSEMA